MDCSTPGFPVLHYFLEFAQTHIHCVYGTIQLFHPLSPLLLLPSAFPSIRVFSSELALHIRWPTYWSFSFSMNIQSRFQSGTFVLIDELTLTSHNYPKSIIYIRVHFSVVCFMIELMYNDM